MRRARSMDEEDQPPGLTSHSAMLLASHGSWSQPPEEPEPEFEVTIPCTVTMQKRREGDVKAHALITVSASDELPGLEPDEAILSEEEEKDLSDVFRRAVANTLEDMILKAADEGSMRDLFLAFMETSDGQEGDGMKELLALARGKVDHEGSTP